MKFWKNEFGALLVDAQGRLIDCPDCPCECVQTPCCGADLPNVAADDWSLTVSGAADQTIPGEETLDGEPCFLEWSTINGNYVLTPDDGCEWVYQDPGNPNRRIRLWVGSFLGGPGTGCQAFLDVTWDVGLEDCYTSSTDEDECPSPPADTLPEVECDGGTRRDYTQTWVFRRHLSLREFWEDPVPDCPTVVFTFDRIPA